MPRRIPFANRFAEGAVKVNSRETLRNAWIDVAQEGAVSRLVRRKRPGMVSVSTAGAVRGMHVFDGTLYAVMGTGLYSITSGGTVTSVGTIAGSGAVTMDDNGGGQLVIEANPAMYVYTTGGGVVSVTDPDFPGASSVTVGDGYAIFTEPDSQKFWLTAINDATLVDGLDFASAESRSDDLVRAYIQRRELILFGSRSIEVWQNTGNNTFPFERFEVVNADIGLLEKNTVARRPSGLFFLGSDYRVYGMQGYTPQVISTPEITRQIMQGTTTAMRGFCFDVGAHEFYGLTVPDVGTYVYDVTVGNWMVWNTWDDEHWHVEHAAAAYGREYVGGADGVWYLSETVYKDGTDLIACEMISQPVDFDRELFRIPLFEVHCEVGFGDASGTYTNPQVSLSLSQDGNTWSSELWRSLGVQGAYDTRVTWRRLGQVRNGRTVSFRIQQTDPVKFAVLDAFAEFA